MSRSRSITAVDATPTTTSIVARTVNIPIPGPCIPSTANGVRLRSCPLRYVSRAVKPGETSTLGRFRTRRSALRMSESSRAHAEHATRCSCIVAMSTPGSVSSMNARCFFRNSRQYMSARLVRSIVPKRGTLPSMAGSRGNARIQRADRPEASDQSRINLGIH